MKLLFHFLGQFQIYLKKKKGDSIRNIIGVSKEDKHIALVDFFTERGEYKLAPYLEEAYRSTVPNAFQKEFKEIDMTWDSKDMYVVFKDGTKIQFRGFSGDNLSGWQGEVKGSKANQGKIGGGPINLLLKLHTKTVDGKTVDIKVAQKLKNKKERGAVTVSYTHLTLPTKA
mgnify:CR=1 FL=1